jgi:hypothetical protein
MQSRPKCRSTKRDSRTESKLPRKAAFHTHFVREADMPADHVVAIPVAKAVGDVPGTATLDP